MILPSLIQIETIVTCNARCTMCGMNVLARKRGKMSWVLFEKIIADMVEMGGFYTICPFINGDPLCDNRMLNMLQYIKERLPDIEIGWYTNGLLLTEDILCKLIEIGNVGVFNISIHGGSKEIYEAVMGLSWDDLVEKLALLTSINNDSGKPFEVRAHMCNFSMTHDSIDDFRELCAEFGMVAGVCCFSNFGGTIRDDDGEAPFKNMPYKLCNRSQNHVYILWDGTVIGCCFDVNGVNRFGNVNEQSLKEIWESPEYMKFRTMHRDGLYKEIPICRDCNSNRFSG
jgi:radical SAM protein with 4Fe4S-binding SPASM domain